MFVQCIYTEALLDMLYLMRHLSMVNDDLSTKVSHMMLIELINLTIFFLVTTNLIMEHPLDVTMYLITIWPKSQGNNNVHTHKWAATRENLSLGFPTK